MLTDEIGDKLWMAAATFSMLIAVACFALVLLG
jgi:hypothetical protein